MADANLMPQLVEGEPRIRDVDLGARLGFARTLDVRKLIERHRESLNRISVLATVAQTPGDTGGRPSSTYYLNKKQAIFITAKSETPAATEITIEIIERFDAYERGAAVMALPMSDEEVMARGLVIAGRRIEDLQRTVSLLEPKAAALDRIATADGSLNITETAKALQMRPKDLFSFLQANNWIYRRAGSEHFVGYQARVQSGDVEHKVTTVLRADGTEKITEQARITPRGLAKLAKLMPGRPGLLSGEAA